MSNINFILTLLRIAVFVCSGYMLLMSQDLITVVRFGLFLVFSQLVDIEIAIKRKETL